MPIKPDRSQPSRRAVSACALIFYFLAGIFAHAEPLPYEFWKSHEAAFNELVFSRTPGTYLPLAPSLEPNAFSAPRDDTARASCGNGPKAISYH